MQSPEAARAAKAYRRRRAGLVGLRWLPRHLQSVLRHRLTGATASRSPTLRHRPRRVGFAWLAQEAEGASSPPLIKTPGRIGRRVTVIAYLGLFSCGDKLFRACAAWSSDFGVKFLRTVAALSGSEVSAAAALRSPAVAVQSQVLDWTDSAVGLPEWWSCPAEETKPAWRLTSESNFSE